MTTAANSYYFRRRTIGRAASPPTWACYEEIAYDDDDDDDYSDSCSDDSCSEDDEDYLHLGGRRPRHSSDSEESGDEPMDRKLTRRGSRDNDMDMDQDGEGVVASEKDNRAEIPRADMKGKQRAVDHEPEPTRERRHRKKDRQPVHALRPILTIHRSQGFVWNQDLFIPPYAKDRYVASTSPPNARGFLSSASTNPDYEVEVVEIRVKEGELDDIFH